MNTLPGRTRLAGAALLLAALVLFSSGCGAIVGSATSKMADNLAAAIQDNNDLETVKEGGPAFLLLIDGMARSNPGNVKMLIAGAKLYSAYGGVFFPEGTRAMLLSDKALDYGMRAVCAQNKKACGLRKMPHDEFLKVIDGMRKKDVPALFACGSAWAGWISARREDWNAIAEVSRVSAIMEKVAELDEGHEKGAVHLYLGTLASLAPKALGGKPEKGLEHFNRAFELSDGANLMAKVLIAQMYARMVLDREMHDQILNEVLAADPGAGGMTLVNTMAQKQAQELLETADDWF